MQSWVFSEKKKKIQACRLENDYFFDAQRKDLLHEMMAKQIGIKGRKDVPKV